jgi:uncharacterized protein
MSIRTRNVAGRSQHLELKHAAAGIFVGLALFGVSMPAMATDYAPIDCAKASLATEEAICRNYDLGQSEARMATLFGVVTGLVAMGQRGDLGESQRQWIKSRNECGTNLSCIADAYKTRIRTLSDVMDGIASHGPF